MLADIIWTSLARLWSKKEAWLLLAVFGSQTYVFCAWHSGHCPPSHGFLLQPDLPVLWRKGISGEKGDRSRYYLYETPDGYIDYPFSDGTVRPPQYRPKPRAENQLKPAAL